MPPRNLLANYIGPRRRNNAVEFFEAEKDYFTNPRNFEFLTALIEELLKEHHFPLEVTQSIGDKQTRKGDSTDLYFVGGVMA